MTPEQIRAAITADPALLALVHGYAQAPSWEAVAAALGVDEWTPTEIGKGTILEALGLEVGNALCDLLDTAPAYRHVRHLLTDGRLRLDAALVRGSLQQLVGVTIAEGVTFTQGDADKLFALARRRSTVSELDVRRAVFNADGTLRV